jgi:fructose-1-phosphate kinase PfkB-like protein
MIVTVTLNPAVDEEFLVPEFRRGGGSEQPR